MTHTFYHTEINSMMKSFRYDAHPMGMFVSTIAALSTFHPEANPALAGEKIYKVSYDVISSGQDYKEQALLQDTWYCSNDSSAIIQALNWQRIH